MILIRDISKDESSAALFGIDRIGRLICMGNRGLHPPCRTKSVRQIFDRLHNTPFRQLVGPHLYYSEKNENRRK